ncbi:FAD-dependent oxidoreductase [Amaricoccus sp.]|uniref:FAD-dependent oxidoreductase n=1 Tax=Amaricoccus sp. TaxID=1872485 RepID=UPI001B4469C1|nr:FAD-dependent oxidoreductase [Amaricoccus sp.]MBP7002937.1 FAD-dependent oxidoreductase [Amaricoccus sp.]
MSVLVIGAGPAGLAAAAALVARGHRPIVVDREPEAGGIPRFCPHPTFGLADAFRPMTGPAWARRLAARAAGADLRLGVTVTALGPDGAVTLSDAAGERTIRPERVLLATGARETPRAARLVSGDRPRHVLTTGALQRLLATGGGLPFSRPVIVGSELVAFSAALQLREHGARPVAMIEEAPRIAARRPADLAARLLLGVPILTGHKLAAIRARPDDASRLDCVLLRDPSGAERALPCDAVVLTGRFVPEAALLPGLDPGAGGPAIDQCWRLAEPRLYAAGNLLRPIETAGWAAAEGRAAAHALADDLDGRLPAPGRRIPLVAADPLRLVVPSAIAVPGPQPGPLQMCVRMARPATGRLTLAADGAVFWRSRRLAALPERRLRLTRALPDLTGVATLAAGFEED